MWYHYGDSSLSLWCRLVLWETCADVNISWSASDWNGFAFLQRELLNSAAELATSYVPVLPKQNVSQLYRASYYRSYRQRFQVVIKQVTGAPGHCGLPYFQPAASLRSNRLNYIQLCWVGWRSASNMWGILKSQPVFLLGKLSFDGWQWWTCSSSLWEQHI